MRRPVAWPDGGPLAVAAGLKDRDGALALISDGGPLGRWSWIGAEPSAVHVGALDLALLRSGEWSHGVVGLIAYDAGARPATGPRPQVWPDLMLARYPALLTFDHHTGETFALGDTEADAARAEAWLALATDPDALPPPAATFTEEAPPAAYEAAVADVVSRIASGEIFQANIARAWSGRLKPWADPFDVFTRLAGRASAYGAFWRLGDRALVSNSPELFLTFDPDSRRIETRPIKGTRPRDPDPAADARLARQLAESAKDRAENLMIVDLMRNDLARVSTPGSVHVERLFEIETHPTVHHLVSTVTSKALPVTGFADLLDATFPPGSITGAPKHQAMKIIAAHEPPRGPWCGSLFHIDGDGRLTASVLIRTASFEQSDGVWSVRALAGAGIVADSDPAQELAETEVKISALKQALVG